MSKFFILAKKRVLVAGGTGLIGGALVQELAQSDCEVLSPTRAQLDLSSAAQTSEYFDKMKPDAAILAAARVGGIGANMNQPYDFLVDNLLIQMNFLMAANVAEVPRVVFLGSSCIYPRSSPQPIPESALGTGRLEPTNSAYAIAKLAGIEFVNSVRAQFKRNWISVLPSNLYGPGDNFNYQTSHVVPALLRKIHEAKARSADQVTLWGSGQVRREFLYSHDAARGIVSALEDYESDTPVNIGYGQDLTIAELAQEIADVIGFDGKFVWDSSMPDGVPQKLLNSSRINAIGWHPETALGDGLRLTYEWMLANAHALRL